jgi:hypothetical protein
LACLMQQDFFFAQSVQDERRRANARKQKEQQLDGVCKDSFRSYQHGINIWRSLKRKNCIDVI